MNYILVRTGSLNRAVILKNILEKYNIKSTSMRTPQQIKKGGCSYCLKTESSKLDKIKQVCWENDIPIKIYAYEGGEYYDISG